MEDWRYVFQRLRRRDDGPEDDGLAAPTTRKLQSSSGGDAEELALKYFSQLSHDDVRALHRHFSFDFAAFDYRADEYYHNFRDRKLTESGK